MTAYEQVLVLSCNIHKNAEYLQSGDDHIIDQPFNVCRDDVIPVARLQHLKKPHMINEAEKLYPAYSPKAEYLQLHRL